DATRFESVPQEKENNPSSAPSQISLFHRKDDGFQHVHVQWETRHERSDLCDFFRLHHRFGSIVRDAASSSNRFDRGLDANISRMQATGGNSMFATFQGGNQRKSPNAELACRVRRRVKSRALRGNAADVEDSSAALRFHNSHGRAGTKKWSPQIRGDDFVPGVD